MNITVTMNLGSQGETPDFCLTGSLTDLVCLVRALKDSDPQRLPLQDDLLRDLQILLNTVRARGR